MQLVLTALVGVGAGVVAAAMLRGQPGVGRYAWTAGLGMLGALAAAFIGQITGLYAIGEAGAFVGALIGATALLAVHHVTTRP